jgi:glycosyltransferase involved in cell wall biosynthesis
VLERDSAGWGRRGRLPGCCGWPRAGRGGGCGPPDGCRVVHAHNVHPSFGWRALAAARLAGARVILHLHNYRLVCAVGTCFTRGEDCTRCHGRDTRPGRATQLPRRLARRIGGLRRSALVAAAAPRRSARRLRRSSAFALRRLRALGAPVDDRAMVLPSVQRDIAERSAAASGRFALAAGRLSPEKGFADAIAACRAAGCPSWWPATGRRLRSCTAGGRGGRPLHRPHLVRRAGRSAPRGGSRHRPIALRRDPAPRGTRGHGRGTAGGGRRRGRAR